jgi:uncharacterized protein involved in exopolysaccharide biosynthesis
MEEFSPIETFTRASRRWWLVALCVFIGGLLGWGFHFFQAPVYEAKAAIVAQVDMTQTGNLTELEQDQAMNAVMALFVSPAVLDKVREEAQAQGISRVEIAYDKNLLMERKRSILELKVRDRDPQAAAKLANLWVEEAYRAFDSASQHARRARLIQQQLTPSMGCPTPAPGSGEGCLVPTPAGPALAPTLEADLNRELAAGSGIIPAMVYSLSHKAEVPDEPVALRVEFLTLAGALVGFLFGSVIASSGQPGSSQKESSKKGQSNDGGKM